MNKTPENLGSCSNQCLDCSGQIKVDCEPKDALPGLLRTVRLVPHFSGRCKWIHTSNSPFPGHDVVVFIVNVVTSRSVAAARDQKIPLKPA